MKKLIKWFFIYFLAIVVLLNTWFFISGGPAIGIYTTLDLPYFDYDDLSLKAKSHTFLGYREPPCIGFGCIRYTFSWFELYGGEITYKNKCYLTYFDIKNWETYMRSIGAKNYKYKDISGLGYAYLLDCEPLKYATVTSSQIPKPYYTLAIEGTFGPIDILTNYPNTLSKILEKGYKLPDKNNPRIELVPIK